MHIPDGTVDPAVLAAAGAASVGATVYLVRALERGPRVAREGSARAHH
ncbi:MAG: hypothetical protein ACK4MD_09925 [Demequina sp.]